MKDTTRPIELEALCEAFLALQSADSCRRFLEDLCTPCELQSLADRWTVARMLARGIPYRKICELTGVSTATVARVARALSTGGGYRQLLASHPGEQLS